MNDELAIRKLMAGWIEGAVAQDSARVAGLMAQDAVFLQPGQPPLHGRAAFVALQDSNTGKFNLTISQNIVEIVVHGNIAYCWTQMTVVIKPTDGSPAIHRAGPTLSFLEKRAGVWLIVRDANMLTRV